MIKDCVRHVSWMPFGVYGLVVARAQLELWEVVATIRGWWNGPWIIGEILMS